MYVASIDSNKDDDSFKTDDRIIIVNPSEIGEHPDCQLATIQTPTVRPPNPVLINKTSLEMSVTMTELSERTQIFQSNYIY